MLALGKLLGGLGRLWVTEGFALPPAPTHRRQRELAQAAGSLAPSILPVVEWGMSFCGAAQALS